ncbi:MAG: DUF5615 family PIN-like protein [Crocosphaera sp.]|nr:DUF5615 family PIN-like protein [Crocosphaera sp.]
MNQVDPQIVLQLRRRGIDVTTTITAGLRTASDESQLDFIRQQKRVIFTHDQDFLIIASQTTGTLANFKPKHNQN